MSSPVRYDGEVAVVTGGGRGLGREFARLLASRGASVVVNDVGVSLDGSSEQGDGRAESPAETTVAEIVAEGGAAVVSTADVSDPAGARSIVDQAVGEFGRCDMLINNAGILVRGLLEEVTLDDFRRVFAVHLGGSFNMAQAVWPVMRAQGGGRILNVCSTNGIIFGDATMSMYDAAKGGLVGFTRSLAVEGEEHGIRVNGLAPGGMTRMKQGAAAPPRTEIPMDAALVAPPACWLVSAECGVTGGIYQASSGRMGLVYVSCAEGYQSPDPSTFTLEDVRDHWAQVETREPAYSPVRNVDFNEWRIDVFRRHTGG